MSRTLSIVMLAVASVGLTVVSAATQDPLTVSPDAYRLEFENAWVRVVRVVYGAKAVIAPHFHTELASAYVYLNDGGPILFKHEGLPYAGVTRPATKAGSFRVYKGLHEVHSVENPTETPSKFLRVEFKTEPLDEASLKGKFFRDEPVATTNAQRIQFDNAQIRITRVRVIAGDTLALTANAEPALMVVLTTTGVAAAGGDFRQLGPGTTAWLDSGQSVTIGRGTVSGEMLRFDFKTRPLDSR